MTKGYLYCVYSDDGKPNKYFEDQFLVSYKSLKDVLPNCNVTLYTNIRFNNIYDINNIIYDENIEQSHISKAVALHISPYEKTILLDTDTKIHRKIIDDIFLVLDEFSFTCCYGNNWNRGEIYPDLNTGLIGVKKNDFTNQQISNWIQLFKEGKTKSDQKSFRQIFIDHKKEFHILPTYFMYRWHHYRTYPMQAVLSHDHSMSKQTITKKIIQSYSKSLFDFLYAKFSTLILYWN